jgi:hypothetical protein
MGDMMLAYAIDRNDHGWRWRVFDVEGELIAKGIEPSQGEAEAAAFSAAERRRSEGTA